MKANMKRLTVALLAMLLTVSAALAGCTPDDAPPADAVLSSIAIEDGYKKEYTVGATFKEDLKIRATYTPSGTRALTLKSAGVSYTPNPFTFDSVGEKELTVSYTENEVTKTAKATFTVVEAPTEGASITMFAAPQSYSNYMTSFKNAATNEEGTPLTIAEHADADNRDYFMLGGGIYKVGNVNGFRFVPDARGLNPSGKQTIFTDPETTFEIYVKDSEDAAYPATAEAAPEQYVTKKSGEGQNNIYYFTEKALGKVIKLVVSPDADAYDLGALGEGDDTIEAELLIVDGYNVYNLIGLSVLDNLNVKNWHDIKEAAGTLPWDEKPLIDYNVLEAGERHNIINQVVLHENITIEPDELPDNYFWDKDRNIEKTYSGSYGGGLAGQPIGDQGYESVRARLAGYSKTQELHYDELLDGSLRDYEMSGGWHNFDTESNGDLAEKYRGTGVNMQKAVYNVAGTGIEGNCMQITIHEEGQKHKLYTVFDGSPDKDGTQDVSPLSHWSLIKYMDEGYVGGGALEWDPVAEQSKPVEGAYPNLKTENGYEFNVEPVVENVRIIGNMPRVSKTEGMPAQLMAFNTCVNELHLKNTMISKLFVAVISDQKEPIRSNVDISDCKIVDIYSNMFYSWRSDNKVTRSVLQDAGGPLFLLCDGDRCDWDRQQAIPFDRDMPANDEDTSYGPHLDVDAVSILESEAAGYEPWYVLNNVSDMFGQIKGGNNDGLADAARGYLGREVVHKNEDDVELINVIAAVICEPGNLVVEKNYRDSLTISGRITVGDEVFEMRPTFPKAPGFMGSIALENLLGANAPVFMSEDKAAIYGASGMEGLAPSMMGFGGCPIATTTGGSNNTWVTSPVQSVYAAWMGVTSSHLFITMRVSAKLNVQGQPTAVTPRFGILIGSVTRAPLPQA